MLKAALVATLLYWSAFTSGSTKAIQARSVVSDYKTKLSSFRELSCLGWATFDVFKMDLLNVALPVLNKSL